MTRLQRFRAFMARMNPTVDPLSAIREGFYVERPGGSVRSALKPRLEVDPVSTHLVLGGIGSGKTSELLVSARALRSSLQPEGDHVDYIDVSKDFDLDRRATAGVLVALAGLSLSGALADLARKEDCPPDLEDALQDLRRHARGYSVARAPYQEHFPGVLDDDYEAIQANDAPDLSELVEPLKILVSHLPGSGKHAIFFFDSLDRLPRPENFVTLVQHDMAILKRAGIGAVVVGPVRYVAGSDRGLTELFDHTQFQLSIDPHDPAGLNFLCEILRRRAGQDDLLPDECLQPLALASGGVLRDLITLAKRAVEEAYVAGRDRVQPSDVAVARDAMGRGLAIGLDDEQLSALRKVHASEKFVVRGERELSLLETRRVLMYEGSRRVVHPALAPLLGLMPEVS